MRASIDSGRVIRFVIFEVDMQAGELRKRGRPVKLQEQPFQILAMLLERPGAIVTRDVMRARLWPADTYVDFDHGLNSAVARLREALDDSADKPRFIETVPRKGYRFISELSSDEQAPAAPEHLPEKPASRRGWFAGGAVALLVIAALLVAFVWRRGMSSLPPIEVLPLASLSGYEECPRFSRDGRQVAFHLFNGPNDSGIFSALVGGEKPLRLTNQQGDCCPAWSPDGSQVAFLRLTQNDFGVYAIPALGGTERKLYSGHKPLFPGLDWSPDGKWLAFPEASSDNPQSWITLLSLGDLSTRRLTLPPADVRDNGAVFSPDGKTVAFIRGTLAGVVSDLFMVPVNGGEARRLTSEAGPMYGLSWMPDGREIVFSATRAGKPSLWRIPVSGGRPHPVPGTGTQAYSPSVAPAGNMLAYQEAIKRDNIWRITLKDEKHAQGAPTKLISDKGSKMRPQFSPDGRRISFESDRLGSTEIWACDIDGANCAQLTSLHGWTGTARWSPDGHTIAFEFHPGERAEVYVLDVPGGTPRQLITNPGADNLAPSWSRDGQWIYFSSKSPKPGGGPFQLWKVPARGGKPVQITTTGGVGAAESADGRFLYFVKYELGGLWRMPLHGGPESLVLDKTIAPWWFNWTLTPRGIYFLDWNDDSKSFVNFFEFASQKITPILTFNRPPRWGLPLSPDGKSLLFVESDYEESSIMIVKNFR
jgi:Tol biopolymer transport system component/DNA-binding winged helix-turn-helix (wHTH) protein